MTSCRCKSIFQQSVNKKKIKENNKSKAWIVISKRIAEKRSRFGLMR